MKTFIQFITEDDMARSAAASARAAKRVAENEQVEGLRADTEKAIEKNQ